MTVLVEQVYAEALRYVYALSTSRWPETLLQLTLAALFVIFLGAAFRLRNANLRRTGTATHRTGDARARGARHHGETRATKRWTGTFGLG